MGADGRPASPGRRELLAGALALAPAAALAEPVGRPSPSTSRPWAGGRLDRYDAFPSRWVDPRTVYVWTPRGYPRAGVRYDAVYAQDGQNLFLPAESYGGKTWRIAEHLQALIDAGEARPTIMVGVWNTPRRGQEYAPRAGQGEADLGLLARDWGGAIVSDRYVAFLADELKPFVDRAYRTAPERHHAFLMGSSMGGLISLYAFISRPRTFGGAACVSTHWPIRWPANLDADPATATRIGDAFLAWVDANLPPPDRNRLYFDHGTATLDAHYPPFQTRMNAILKAHGYVGGLNFESLVFPGAAHEEAAWDARLDTPLKFLLAPA